MGTTAKTRSRRGGFTMVEVVVSAFIVSMMLVMSLESVGATTRGKAQNGAKARARQLIRAMMDEITAQAYEDSDNPVFGPETGEVTGDRTQFDDVDDYNRWYSTPPKKRDGTPLANMSDFYIYVGVYYADPDDDFRVTSTPTGVKLVWIYVWGHNQLLATGQTLVTAKWDRE